MSYLLRNDSEFTVRVAYEGDGFLLEVHRGLFEVVANNFARAEDCIEIAQLFVDHHISSHVLWSLANDRTAAPVIRPKSAEYTEACRQKVETLYK